MGLGVGAVLLVGVLWYLRPGPPPTVAEETPPGPAPGQSLDDLKAATAFIKVSAGPLRGSGSGFLIQQDGTTGYVATNEHVVNVTDALPGGRLTIPAEVTVVFWSGTKQEQSYRAEVVAADSEHDLAVLKVAGAANLPQPLLLQQSARLSETLPVTVLGFPFGEALAITKGNPSITIAKGSVSSIRRNAQDEVVAVQIDGALNPGNSGGPVVDADGRLVGIAAATIRGTHIGLAIPAAELSRLLEGKAGDVRARMKNVTDANAEVEIEVPLLDPLRRLQSVTVHYLRNDLLQDQPQADAAGNWPPLPDGQRVSLRIEGSKAVGTIVVLAADKDRPYSFQAAYVNRSGKQTLTQPKPVALSGAGPAAGRGRGGRGARP